MQGDGDWKCAAMCEIGFDLARVTGELIGKL